MNDVYFKQAMRDKLTAEYMAGAQYILRELRNRAQHKEPNSPEQLELFRAVNAIQGQLGTRREKLQKEYRSRGL